MKCCKCQEPIISTPEYEFGGISACPKCMSEFKVLIELSVNTPNIFKSVIDKWKKEYKLKMNIIDIRNLDLCVGDYQQLFAIYYLSIGKNANVMLFNGVYLSVQQAGHYLKTLKPNGNKSSEQQHTLATA